MYCVQAMDLEVPVVARDIPGNTAVVQHEVTGLLYSSPQVRTLPVVTSQSCKMAFISTV